MIYILQIYGYIYITCMILTNSGWRTWEILFIFLQLKWVHFIVGKLCCAVLSRFSRVQLFVTLWTIALQAPLSMGKLYLSKAKSQTWLSDWTELNWKLTLGFPGSSDGKEYARNVQDLGSIPGLERSPGEGNDYPLQYSCLENSMDRGAWRTIVHGVSKSQTQPSNFYFFKVDFVEYYLEPIHLDSVSSIHSLSSLFSCLYRSYLIILIEHIWKNGRQKCKGYYNISIFLLLKSYDCLLA